MRVANRGFVGLTTLVLLLGGASACTSADGEDSGTSSTEGDVESGEGEATEAGGSQSDASESSEADGGDGDGDTNGDTNGGDGDGDGDASAGEGDGDGDAETGDGDGDGDGDGSPDVPPGAHCEPVANWDTAWVAWEQELLQLTNEARAAGGVDCGTHGVFDAAPPLTMQPHLRCAARLHSKDMNEREFFSHGTWPLPGDPTVSCGNDNDCGGGELCDDQLGDGGPTYCLEGPASRLNAAGYPGRGWGENILYGYGSASTAFNAWVQSDGHCRNLMNPDFSEIGMGYSDAPGTMVRRAATMVLGG